MLAAVKEAMAANHYDLILQLCCWPSVQATSVSPAKIKAKDVEQVQFEVVGGIDLAAELKELCKGTCALAGYAQGGSWFSEEAGEFESLLAVLRTKCAQPPLPPQEKMPLTGPLAGMHVVITSGPTAETLSLQEDVLTNFSTGAQGAAIAQELAGMGARVSFISGPGVLPCGNGIAITRVTTATQMLSAVHDALPADIFIAVAAVADFAPIALLPKLQQGERAMIPLRQNPDILSTIGHLLPGQRPRLVVGFAAENEAGKLEDYALGKMHRKNADAICANAINPSILAGGKNDIRFFWREGGEVRHVQWIQADKARIAQELARMILRLRGSPDAVGKP